MSNLAPSGNATFDALARAAEITRLNAVTAAGSSQALVSAAEITYYKTLYTGAIANVVDPTDFSMALRGLGTAP